MSTEQTLPPAAQEPTLTQATSTPEQHDEHFNRLEHLVHKITSFKPNEAVEWQWTSDSEPEDIDDTTVQKQSSPASSGTKDAGTSSGSSSRYTQKTQLDNTSSTHDLETPTKQTEKKSTVDEGNDDDDDTTVNMVRISGHDLERLFTDMSTPIGIIMLVGNKQVMGEAYVARPDSQDVFGKAEVRTQKRISTMSELRGCTSFRQDGREVSELWKKRLIKEKKSLYLWEMIGVKRFEKPMKIRGKLYFKSCKIPLSRLVSQDDLIIPSPNLKETAVYFMNLLSAEDQQRLKETMDHLDTCVVKVGGTCSGTDIAVSVIKATIAAFAEHFQASC